MLKSPPPESIAESAEASDTPSSLRRRRRSMVMPEAYDERAMPSLQLARSSRLARRIGQVITALLLAGFVLIALAPWQQSVKGTGTVTAYDPSQRQQTIESPTKGRVAEWGEGIFENAHVEQGQLIARIQDLDESFTERLEAQVKAGRDQVQALQSQIDASLRNLDAAQAISQTLASQVRTYGSVKEQVTAGADFAIESARSKVESESQKLNELRATLTQAEQDYYRQKVLSEEKAVAVKKFQEAEQKYRESLAKVSQAEANIAAAEADLEGKRRDRDAKERKAQADIEYAQSTLDKAIGDIAKSESEIAKAQSELQKAQKELFESEIKLSRQRTQNIEAPFDGFLTQIMPNQGSVVLKEGDPICVIVPDTRDRAVQIWLSGNDAPLVEPGRHVRLQFEGWPAVQFAGWPSVAVGTFGGVVTSVDAIDDGKGRFRILVLPAPDEAHPWPDDRYLRQGVRTNGWVLLETVPLWYEIWRNMNGFPPALEADESNQKSGGPKIPKLPKA